MVTSLLQPAPFLFASGTGLSPPSSRGLPTGIDFRAFKYRGVPSMPVSFTAILLGGVN